jgi:hypothetical protein
MARYTLLKGLQCPLLVLTKSFVLPQRKALNAKMSTFFDLMTMEGNRGWKPLYFSSDEPKKRVRL